MKASAVWPATAAERRDRDRVVELVRMVGEQKLVWTVHDVQRAAKEGPRLQLNHSGQLSRHIHALDRELVTRVAKRLDFGRMQNGGRPSRAKHRFVLTSRLPEYQAGGVAMDDLERVYCALWVAIEATGSQEVPTKIVTWVLQNVEALALVTPRNTVNHLIALHTRNQRVVEKEKSGRWSLWHPLGPRPEHPDFDAWVRRCCALDVNGTCAPGSGHATQNSMAHELVVCALRLTKSSTWPAGRSVQIADIRAAVGRDPRAGELAAMLRERGRMIGSVLSDLTKERIAGRKRVETLVVKVGTVVGSAAYYDAPHVPGFERRRLIVAFRALQAELAANTLKQLDAEARAAEHLRARARSEILRCIATLRLILVHRQLTPADRLIRELEDNSHLLGKKVREGIEQYRAKLSHFISRLPHEDSVAEEARQRLEAVEANLEEAIGAERPLITPHDYVAFLPRHGVGGLSPSEFLHRVKMLRRFPNPNFVRQTDEDPTRSARYCVDRAEALCYLAERYQGRVYAFLRAGLRVLGRDFRSPVLARRLAHEVESADRRARLAALVLLGDEQAGMVANAWLRESERPEEIADALQALLVLGQIEPMEWSKRIRSSQSRIVRDMLTQVVLAERSGRRLLQR